LDGGIVLSMIACLFDELSQSSFASSSASLLSRSSKVGLRLSLSGFVYCSA
jgi:hypothetical protein